jgi:hypothetical protein
MPASSQKKFEINPYIVAILLAPLSFSSFIRLLMDVSLPGMFTTMTRIHMKITVRLILACSTEISFADY